MSCRPVPSILAARLLTAALFFGAASCAGSLAEERPAVAQAQEVPGGDGIRTVDLVQTPGKISPQRLTLPPGRYVFRVRSEDASHPVSFHLARMTPQLGIGDEVPGTRLEAPLPAGEVATTTAVELSPGKYTYRGDLNPTPHYFLDVR